MGLGVISSISPAVSTLYIRMDSIEAITISPTAQAFVVLDTIWEGMRGLRGRVVEARSGHTNEIVYICKYF